MKNFLLYLTSALFVALGLSVNAQTTTVEVSIIQNGEMATDTLDDVK
jgi:hypothetical protein